MKNILDKNDSPIVLGIKSVGIGKRGSKSIGHDLASEILADLKAGKVDPVALGAFFGALYIKGITKEEQILDKAFEKGTLSDPKKLIEAIAPNVSSDIKNICVKLLNKEELSLETSHTIGKFLLSDVVGDAARGLIISILRVRYETPDEYEGILKSIQETIEQPFTTPPFKGKPILQLAEPFDGASRSYLITPLIANYFQAAGYRVISLIGRNSGPKFGNNLLGIVEEMGIPVAQGNNDIKDRIQEYGCYISQADLSKPLDRWVEKRRKTIKRPCFSTLEKFLNPAGAKILITSAFHPPYGNKMLNIAERANFPGIIVVRNGIEGSIAFPLKRAAKILCSARQKNGEYIREEINLDPETDYKIKIDVEEKLLDPSLFKNCELIQEYSRKKKTQNEKFDLRVKFTCEGLNQAVKWIEKKLR